MNYLELVGQKLKSEFLLDLFETYDVDVIYAYDRTHENLEDEYIAVIPEMGLEFIFNESQVCTTLFMRFVSHTGYNPFFGDDPRDVLFKSGAEAIEYAKEKSIKAEHQEMRKDSFFGEIPEWVKFHFDKCSVHYQFGSNGPELVTIQLKKA